MQIDRSCSVILLLALWGTLPLHGAVLTSASSFSGTETVITFNNVTQATPVDPYGPLEGVTFDGSFNFGFKTVDGSTLFGPTADKALQQDGLLTATPFNFAIDFGSNIVNRAGFLLAAGSDGGQSAGSHLWQVSAFDAANVLLDTATVDPLPTGAFIGFEYTNNQIKTITVQALPGEGFTFIDDVRFEAITPDAAVPEPASLAMMSTLLVGLGVQQFRKRRST